MAGPKLEEREYYITQKTAPDRNATPGGVYLDDLQRSQAEELRAEVEGRKPDLENPPAVAGTPLRTAEELRGFDMVVLKEEHVVKLPVVTGELERNDDGEPDAAGKKYLKKSASSSSSSSTTSTPTKKSATARKKAAKKTVKRAAAAPVSSK